MFPSFFWRQIVILTLFFILVILKNVTGYQIVSICSGFLGTFPCTAWAVLKGLFALLCWSLKFRNSSKILSVNGFWREMVLLHLIFNTLVKKLFSFRKTLFVKCHESLPTWCSTCYRKSKNSIQYICIFNYPIVKLL